METNVRCNWCGLITEKWCWQQRQKDGSVVAKCQRCVDEGRYIPLIKFKEKGNRHDEYMKGAGIVYDSGHSSHSSK